MAKTVIGGSTVKTSNRLFIELKSYGMCDEKGRTVLGIGLKGKQRAEPDAPIRTLLIPLIEELLPSCHYSGAEARDADLAAFKEFADELKPKEHKDPTT